MVRSSLLHLSIRTYPIRQFSLRVFSRRTVLSHTSALDDSCIDWSDSPSTEDLDNRGGLFGKPRYVRPEGWTPRFLPLFEIFNTFCSLTNVTQVGSIPLEGRNLAFLPRSFATVKNFECLEALAQAFYCTHQSTLATSFVGQVR